ncbi:MAG TPA: hypothetical protein V6D25_31025, partial [Leptolyngbyaceae cyanobacterium]
KKAAEAAKQTTDAVKSGNLNGMGKTGQIIGSIARVISTVASLVGAALGIFNTITIGEILNGEDKKFAAQLAEGNNQFRLLGKINGRVTRLEKKNKILDDNIRTTGLRAQQAFTNSVKARELGNNALYEARQGRAKLEAKINSIQANVNKSLADTNAKFSTLNSQFQNLIKQVTGNAQATIQNTINQIQAKLNSQATQLNNQAAQINNLNNQIKQINVKPQQINEQKIIDTAVAKATTQATAQATTAVKNIVEPQIGEIRTANQTLKVDFASFKAAYNTTQYASEIKDSALANQDKVLFGSISAIADKIGAIQNQINLLRNGQSNSILPSVLAALRAKVDALEKQLVQVQQQNTLQDQKIQQQDQKLQQQNQMNQQGLNVLNNIAPLVALIPGLNSKIDQIPVKVSNAIVPSINQIPDKVGDVIIPEIVPNVDTAICNSVAQGCLSQMQNNIQQLYPKPIDIANTVKANLAGDLANLAANFPPINGSIDCHDCITGATVPLPYAGLGLYGIQSQIEQVSNQIETISKAICRSYRILGGNSWFSGETDTVVNFKVNPEAEIKKKVKLSYRESNSPQADITTQTVQASNLPDLLYTINAASWRRQGLHKLPVEAPPTMFHPNITRNPVNGEIVGMKDWQPFEYVKIPDLISYDTYQLAQFKSVFGEFPITFDAEIEENGKIVKKQVVVDNIPDALNELMGVGLTLQDDLEVNTQLGVKTATELLACKNSSLITQDICLANMKYLGYQVNRKAKTIPVLFTPGTQNLADFMKESKQNIIGYEHRSGHLEFRLNTLEVSAGITKAALTRYPTDEIPGSIIGKDALARIKASDEDWLQFLKMMNNPTGDLKIDDTPQPVVEDITNKVKNDLGKLQ